MIEPDEMAKKMWLTLLFLLFNFQHIISITVYENGFCVQENNHHQNGKIKLNSLNINTQSLKDDCLRRCLSRADATGCEVIWDQSNRGCYVHTDHVARGNGYDRHGCWIIRTSPYEPGFCVTDQNRDQNSGVIKLSSENVNTQRLKDDCLRRCLKYRGAKGCEAIWTQRYGRGCYVHTQNVARGNGYVNHGCWVISTTDELVKRWAPEVKLAVGEQWKPSGVDFFLRHVNLIGGPNYNPLTPSNLPSCNGECYLKTKVRISCASCTDPSVLKGQDNAPVYAMVRKHGYTTDIVYWFFYPYNRGKRVCVGVFGNNLCICPKFWGHCTCPRINGCVGGYSTFGHHVGDWEHVIVRLRNSKPHSFFLSIHDSEITRKFGGKFFWNGRQFKKGNTALGMDGLHAIVYSAAGSHGVWPTVGRNVYKSLPNGDTLVDYTSSGTSWRTWQNMKVVEYKADNSYSGEFSWIKFQGRWGNRKRGCGIAEKISKECILNNGPGGPQRSFIGEGKLAK